MTIWPILTSGAFFALMSFVPPEQRSLPKRYALAAGAVVAGLLGAFALYRHLQNDDRSAVLLCVAAVAVLALAFARSRGWYGSDH